MTYDLGIRVEGYENEGFFTVWGRKDSRGNFTDMLIKQDTANIGLACVRKESTELLWSGVVCRLCQNLASHCKWGGGS